jgi:aspartate/tyrosine/aromatic aminotransferase
MSGRIQKMRELLYSALEARGIRWPHILQQIGMFGYTGLTG